MRNKLILFFLKYWQLIKGFLWLATFIGVAMNSMNRWPWLADLSDFTDEMTCAFALGFSGWLLLHSFYSFICFLIDFLPVKKSAVSSKEADPE